MIVELNSPRDLLAALGVESNLIFEYEAIHAKERQTIRSVKSSYAEHCYDELFYALMRAWHPTLYVEFGVLSGYSLLSASLALQKNGNGQAVGVDLFEQYGFNKDDFSAVQARIANLGLEKYCRIIQCSIDDISPSTMKPDVLHVDISNNGNVVEHCFGKWEKAVRHAIVFEGGSRERDGVEWMIKYAKPAMHPVFEKLSKSSEWSVFQVVAFPSLTVLVRKNAG
jgi:Methyltransferase domain